MALNVTELPLHIEVVLEVIDTAALTVLVLLVIVFVVDVSGFAQGSLLVILTETASPLASVDVVKVEAVCPATFTPLISH